MKITVIGGTRGLGNWIAGFLKEKGFDVTITGRDKNVGKVVSRKMGIQYTQNNVKAASMANVVIVAVPIATTAETIREIAPYLKEGTLLVDVTSVKEEPSKVMAECAPEGVEVLPAHPMFSQRIQSLDGQVVVLTPIKKKGKWYPKVLNFLRSENARVLLTTPENHDQMMSIVQGLTHFAYICVASTIEKLQIDVKESRKFASPVYSLMLDMIARIVAQNPYLCYSIQTHNSHIKKIHDAFLKTVVELKDMISSCQEKEFTGRMSSAAKHLDDLEAALGRSDKAISALTEEISLLKNSVGKEVGLKHIYSGKVHIGILKELSANFAVLKHDNREIKLKLSNVRVLNKAEISKWKIKNLPKKVYDVSVVFPENCNPKIIEKTIENLKGVVDASLIDIYQGSQIKPGKKSVTIRYSVINPEIREAVEDLLKGFGGSIR